MSSIFDLRAVRGALGFAAVLVLAAGVWWPQPLAAQSGSPPPASDPARDASARALFEEGVAFTEAGDLVSAEDRYRRALSLRDSPVIVYNLASTLVERGKLVEASELLHKLVRDESLPAELRQSATDLQAQTAPRIARLRVIVEGGAATDQVTLDGQPLLQAQLGVDIPVDPGSHELQLQRDTRQLDAETFELASGGTLELALQAGAAELAPSAVAAASVKPAPLAQPSAADRGVPITSTWWFWTGAAVLAGAAIATAVILASGSDPEPSPPFRGDFDPPSLALEVDP